MAYAINPYSFVPFAGEVEKKPLDDYYPASESLLTGRLDVTMIAKTPLIVPDGANYQETALQTNTDTPDTHKTYTFYHVKDENGEMRYAIPGSSLCGVLRSAYEAVTNSCLPFFPDNHEISQRVPLYAAFRNRGLLGYDAANSHWTLYSAKEYVFTTQGINLETGVFRKSGSVFKTGDHVQVSVDEHGKIKDMKALKSGDTCLSGWHPGWLQFNIPVVKNRDYHIRVLSPTDEIAPHLSALPDGCAPDPKPWLPTDGNLAGSAEVYKFLKRSLKMTISTSDGHHISTAEDLWQALKDTMEHPASGRLVPVYYLEVHAEVDGKIAKVYYLSGSSVGRVSQKRKWEDVLGRENHFGDHSPCSDLSELCPACALFGTAEAEGTEMDPLSNRNMKVKGAAGRLRFTDAVADTTTVKSLGQRTLPILSEPKPSAYEFYIQQPNMKGKQGIYWNYDFFSVRKDGNRRETEYHHLPEARPRGRKFYWHSNNPANSNSEKEKATNATMEALNAGAVFNFHVYFDRIREDQLRRLIWLITLGENDKTSVFCHKVGHAKPLGYGSVKMLVTGCAVRKLTLSDDGNVQIHTKSFNLKEEKGPKKEVFCDLIPESAWKSETGAAIWGRRDIPEHIRAYLKMCDFSATKGNLVNYPSIGEQIFEWFGKNRTINENHPYPDVLPHPLTNASAEGNVPFALNLDFPHIQDEKAGLPAGGKLVAESSTEWTMDEQTVPEQQMPQVIPAQQTPVVTAPEPEKGEIYDCVAISERGKTWEVKLKDFDTTGTLQLPKKAKIKFKKNMVVRGRVKSIDPNDKKPKLEYIQ